MNDASEMRAPRRAKAVINSMLNQRQITPEGLNWLTNATDPFHDTEIPPTGFPDQDCSRSIAQVYSYTTQVTFPTGLPDGSTWNAHIFLLPITPPLTSTVPGIFIRNTIDASGTMNTIPGINLQAGYNALSVPEGYDWIANTAPYTNSPSIQLPSAACSGQFRMVGAGFEVVNTTPDLYRGGSVTVYRTPTTSTQRMVLLGTVPLPQQVTVLPPSTQAEAQLYPSSRTWGAEDGVYSVATLNSTTNSYNSIQPSCAGATQQMSNAVLSSLTSTVVTWSPNVTQSTFGTARNVVLPYDNHGAIFTGLHKSSTLQVTVRYYMERIPTSSNPDLLVLTRPPTPYDATALEIYSRSMTHLPVGVRVSENPLGEWFNDVMDAVSSWAPKIGNLVGNVVPGAAAVGNMVGSVAGGARAANQASQKKKKKQPPAGAASNQRVQNQKKK